MTFVVMILVKAFHFLSHFLCR